MTGADQRVSGAVCMRLMTYWLLVIAAACSRCSAQTLAERIQPLVQAHRGNAAVAIRHLETGEQFLWRADLVQPTASLIKLPVMVTACRMADAGQLDLSKMLQLTDADKVPGSGILTGHFSAGLQLSVRDAMRLMIRYSDNTATNLVVREIGLPATAACMQELGYAETRLNSFVYRGDTTIAPERSRLYGLGSTTALETIGLLEQIQRGTAAKPESCQAMLQHLDSCDDDTMLAAQLPKGTRIAHKSGAVAASRTDAGLIFGPGGVFAICVLTTENEDRSWDDNNSAHELIAKVARAAWDHFNPEWKQGPTEVAELKLGAFGLRVELLQRTLNARLQPGPNLGVDGDFGPATEAAVRRFQESAGLAVDGIVRAEFWQKLGPVVEPDAVPAPEVVNAEQLPVQPAESLAGPPLVTADAWTIVDVQTGKELAGQESAARKDMASTTKMMTAWLVARLLQKAPELAAETLTMSTRGDSTIGSTSGVRSGESLPVQESLFGLMLPSGNDMATALAEHFGGRVLQSLDLGLPDGEQPSEDPLLRFVQAMNAEAVRLGLTNTHFENPHGLTGPTHYASAADLAALAGHMLQDPLLNQIMMTRQRGAVLSGPGGYQRNVLWKNTNELLSLDGYAGVKTGTTDKAGACLVSVGERDGRRLIVVVLGSAASESRYIDSRNLYRWIWSGDLQPDK
ncbi:MAG: serine hydrolase [Planctomyces sp.]